MKSAVLGLLREIADTKKEEVKLPLIFIGCAKKFVQGKIYKNNALIFNYNLKNNPILLLLQSRTIKKVN